MKTILTSMISLSNGIKLLTWEAALFAALSIARLPGNWGTFSLWSV
jgi:hypothetical protein